MDIYLSNICVRDPRLIFDVQYVRHIPPMKYLQNLLFLNKKKSVYSKMFRPLETS